MTVVRSAREQELASLVDLLRTRAQVRPDGPLFSFLQDGESIGETLDRAELERRARCIGGRLQRLGLRGERVLLLYPAGAGYVSAFFGCLFAGAVAVPAYPPRGKRRSRRLASILEDAAPRAVLTTPAIAERAGSWMAASPGSGELRWIVTGEDGRIDAQSEADWRDPGAGPDDLAFLQYTSGSTSAPRGVMVSHGNLLHNEELIRRAFGTTPDSVVLSWLPLYHDMGLIGTLLQPLYCDARALLMPPVAFLQRPERWLRAISHHRADVSGGPDFAYDLCARRVSDEALDELDLGCWRVAFNGAEPVRAGTLERFTRRFETCGFRASAFVPCYGLAEATLLVSASGGGSTDRTVSARRLERHRAAPAQDGEEVRRLVSSGVVASGLEVAIVDPDAGSALPDGRVGEIWVAGPSVAGGYWRREEATRETFGARLPGRDGTYLRTGDLGFLDRGELFVTGRIKDLLIVRGRNHYPHDVEATVAASHPALGGVGAAFTVEVDGVERVAVVHEVDRRAGAELPAAAEAARRAVAEEHGLRLAEVVLVRQGGVPRTTSGKVQRAECRRRLLAGELPVIERSTLEAGDGEAARAPEAEAMDPDALAALPAAERDGWIEGLVRRELARIGGASAADLPAHRPVTALGLDSVAVLDLSHRLDEALGTAPSVGELLEGPTISELTAALGLRVAARRGARAAPRAPSAPSDAAAVGQISGSATYGQRALWFLQRLDPSSAAYNLAVAVRVRSPLDPSALAAAARALGERHPALRTVFEDRAGELRQVVGGTAPALERVPLPSADPAGVAREIGALANAPFDLERGPLARLRLLEPEGAPPVLVLVVHHAVADSWSLAVWGRELAALYEGRAADLEPPLTSLVEHARRERHELEGAEGDRLWRFWSEALAGAPEDLGLPLDRPRPPVQSFRGGVRVARLPPETTARLRALADAAGATPFVAQLAVWAALLARLSGRDDLVVGTPTTGRAASELAGLFGYLVNPVPVRCDLAGDPSFGDLLSRVRAGALGALAHEDLPFALLAERLRPRRRADRSPVFQVLFTLQAPPPGAPRELGALALGLAGTELRMSGLELEAVPVPSRSSRFDLALGAAEVDGGLALALEYDEALFDATTAERWLRSLVVLAGGAAARPEALLSELPLLRRPERAQLLREWNDTAAPAPAGPLHELIARRAAAVPDRVAVAAQAGQLSYGELLARAGRLAARLGALGAGGATVGVCLRPSPRLPVALLAVLEAGGAYLPLDPSYPRERLALLVEDAAPALIVTEAGAEDALPPAAATRVRVEGAGPPAAPLRGRAPVDPDALAYVLYTSGSSGRPKGVGVSHRALVNFLASMAERPGLAEGDVLLSVTTLSFDIAALELFLPLLVGARTEIASRGEAGDGLRLAARLAACRATAAQATPATWKMLLATGWAGSPELTALSGGEALGRDLAGRIGARCRALWNLYGPTETTVWSAVQPVAAPAAGAAGGLGIGTEAGAGPEALGRPIANTHTGVVDRRLRVLPAGAVGELVIGGAGLARGYLRRPAATAERFVPDPLSPAPGVRLYRTGDLARQRADGTLEFLGRADQQVKVRGHRIEPGEVEAALRRHPGVRDAVVTAPADGTGERFLCAYVVGGDRLPPAEELLLFVRGLLPEPLVPSVVVPLEVLPLTPNGKVDRARLPAPRAPRPAPSRALEGPLEELAAAVWSELLRIDALAPDEDVFALGGHSLLAAMAAARLSDRLGFEVPVGVLFEAPTVARLAEALADLRASDSERGSGPVEPLAAAPRPTSIPLSPGQEKLWLFDRLHPGSPAYLMPAEVRMEGSLDRRALTPKLIPTLARALAAVVARHEALRTRFVEDGAGVRQEVMPPPPPRLPVVDLSALPGLRAEGESARLTAAEGRRPIELSRAPLVRWTLLARPGSDVLLVTTHHAAADAWSLGVFFRDLERCFRAAAEEAPEPPVPTVQFADWVLHERRRLTPERLEADLAHWRARLADPPSLDWPTARPGRGSVAPVGGMETVALPAAVAAALADLARSLGATSYMVWLALAGAVLSRWGRCREVVVGSPFAGRDRVEVEGIVGFFVNTLPLRLGIDEREGFAAAVARAKAVLIEAWEHRGVPGERIADALGGEPPFRVALAEEAPLPEARLGGLRLRPRRVPNGSAKFDLSLFAAPGEDGSVLLSAEYRADLFDAATAASLLRHLRCLATAAAAEPDRPLADLPMLDADERRRVLVDWNRTEAPVPSEPVHRAVARRARERPDALAVAAPDGCLSYGALAARARGLAAALRRRGVGPEASVGVLLERSLDLVVAVLGVLEAGGAYVPIDPGTPARRVRRMLDLAGARVLVTSGALAAVAEEAAEGRAVVRPDEAGGDSAGAEPAAGRLAYTIFTSGSTGEPKGVRVEHAGLANLVSWHRRAYGVGPGARASHLAGLGFDASVWELWPYLAAGASLHLVPEGPRSQPDRVLEWLAAHRITHAFLPTPIADAALAAPMPPGLALRYLLTGGDRLRRGPGPGLPFALVNHYGPTESTVVTTAATLASAGAAARGAAAPPIGRPIANLRAYVVDRHLRPVPPGVPGEVCVAGVGLARGYAEAPARTAERFVPDPFATAAGERLYRTGDLARHLPSGDLDFLGRVDAQVKIRGQRIEPGEVEAALARHPRVSEVAVVAHPSPHDGELTLVAYVVPAPSPAPPPVEELRSHLLAELPSGWLPAAFVSLERLPLTPNGKVDRRALPAPTGLRPDLEQAFVTPRSDLESLLADLWSELLGIDRVGVHDDFFRLGGNSLQIARLVGRLRQELGVEVAPQALFERPTVAQLAATVAQALVEEADDAVLHEVLAELEEAL